MPNTDPNTSAHPEWLGFIQPNGMVVSAPALGDEQRQHQADIASPRQCLTQIDRGRDTEPARGRAFYQVRAQRVEPVGLVYLWPDTE